MFRRMFGAQREAAADQVEGALSAAGTTVRRIVGRLEAMPPDQARLVAATAYTIARAAYADLEISADETAVIELLLQDNGLLDEPTAVLVTEMAKLQARTVGGTEDYVVTRELKAIASPEQRLDVLRACFAVSAANGSISAEESAEVNEIANELDVDPAALASIRAEYHDRITSVQRVRRLAGLSD